MAQGTAAEAVSANTRPAIQMVAVNKWFGEFHVLRHIDLTVDQGEKIVICGPSGSGKSTLIRCINRLEEHQKGKIIVDGIELTNDIRQIDKIRSEVGMVFQSFNLFPHLTVLDNLCLAPVWVKKMPRARGRAGGDAIPGARQDPRAGQQVSGPALGRPAAARRDRPRPVHEPAHHAVRRADLRARSRDDQGGARRHDRARHAAA